ASSRTPRRDLTGPARPAGLRGQCPPASACGECLLLDFAPKACRSRRAVDRRLAVKAPLSRFEPGTAVQAGMRVRMPLGAECTGPAREPHPRHAVEDSSRRRDAPAATLLAPGVRRPRSTCSVPPDPAQRSMNETLGTSPFVSSRIWTLLK